MSEKGGSADTNTRYFPSLLMNGNGMPPPFGSAISQSYDQKGFAVVNLSLMNSSLRKTRYVTRLMVLTSWSGFRYSNSMATRNFPFADIAALTSGNRGSAHTADVSVKSETATKPSRLSDFTRIPLFHRGVAAKFMPIVGFEDMTGDKSPFHSLTLARGRSWYLVEAPTRHTTRLRSSPNYAPLVVEHYDRCGRGFVGLASAYGLSFRGANLRVVTIDAANPQHRLIGAGAGFVINSSVATQISGSLWWEYGN